MLWEIGDVDSAEKNRSESVDVIYKWGNKNHRRQNGIKDWWYGFGDNFI